MCSDFSRTKVLKSESFLGPLGVRTFKFFKHKPKQKIKLTIESDKLKRDEVIICVVWVQLISEQYDR